MSLYASIMWDWWYAIAPMTNAQMANMAVNLACVYALGGRLVWVLWARREGRAR